MVWNDLEVKAQGDICRKYGAKIFPCPTESILGFSEGVGGVSFPINGMRHPPEGKTNGWYIWLGHVLSHEADFFKPIHTSHLRQRAPQIVKFLKLEPGWRFLIDINVGYEDVWYDDSLLNI